MPNYNFLPRFFYHKQKKKHQLDKKIFFFVFFKTVVGSICATCTVAANPCSFLYFFEYFAPLGFNFCSFPSYRAVWVLYHGFMFFQLFLAESELRNF